MAVCNIFNELSKPTGNFLTFSQYSEDLTKGATQYEAYRVVPSKFVVMDIDYKKVKEKLSEYDINGDLNKELPKYFQNYFENGCAYLKQNYNGTWSPKQTANMFWNTLYKSNMLTTTEDNNLNYFINEVRYIGDINIQSYDEKFGEGYSEIYCYIPSDSKAYRYGTIDLKPDESACDCSPYTAKEVDDRIQYINPITEFYEPFDHLDPRYVPNENLEMYMDNANIWSGKTECQCGCESYDIEEVKNALDECDCYPYTDYEIKDRIDLIEPYTKIDQDIPRENSNMWSGPSICNFRDNTCISYDNPEISDRIKDINPITMTQLGNIGDGEDGNIEDYPEFWENSENNECCGQYQSNEIKNRIYQLEGYDIELPVDIEIDDDNSIKNEIEDDCVGECEKLSQKEIEDRIESLNPKTAVSISDDWKYLTNYSNNPNIWDDPNALEQLFEEVDYDVISEQTNSVIRSYINENDYLEGFEGNEDYNIEQLNQLLKVYYADNSLLDKYWIDSKPLLDPIFKDSYNFNTIVILYEIHKIDKYGDWVVSEDYKNLPLGIYFTGKFNEDLSLTNPVTKYIDNDEIYKEGTAYGLRICYKFAVTPNNVSIKSVNITNENDNYSAFCQVMTEMSKSQQKMNNIISSVINQTQYLKDTLSIFRNSRTNVPYLREINGENFWFVNGKLIGKGTVTQTTPVYIDNTTIFPNTVEIGNIDFNDTIELNPIQFAPVNAENLTIKNNGYVGKLDEEDLIIEVDYGDADLINEPFIMTDWITNVEEINE